MKRTQIYLTENEHAFLESEAFLLGLSKAELIRRILDLYINEKNKSVKEVEKDLKGSL